MRSVVLHTNAFEDLLDWSRNDRKILSKVFELIASIQKDPFQGIGKPEPLKHELQGCWSRRINHEHRLVYRVTETDIIILACKTHYKI